jgi:glucose-6-phosphate 1-dehydrogenase
VELTVENPLRVGLRLSDVPGPCALVIFGGSGDLAHRKLVPALYNLALRGLLPAGFAVVGIGRSDYGGDEGYRESMRESVAKYSRTQPLDETV